MLQQRLSFQRGSSFLSISGAGVSIFFYFELKWSSLEPIFFHSRRRRFLVEVIRNWILEEVAPDSMPALSFVDEK